MSSLSKGGAPINQLVHSVPHQFHCVIGLVAGADVWLQNKEGSLPVLPNLNPRNTWGIQDFFQIGW